MIKNKDIAKLLNISTATVSLARNNKPGVSEQTKNSVNEIIREMMEKESKKQEALHGSFGKILFVIHKKHGLVIADTPFFLTLTESVQNQASAQNYSINILHYNETGSLAEHLSRCCEPSVSGILLLASEMTADDLGAYKRCSKPLVVLDSHYPDEHLNTVIINNREAVRSSVKYALSMGHRRIGYLSSTVYTANFEERYQAFLDTMQELGVEADPALVFPLRCTADLAYADMRALLDQSPALPTLFIAGNDLLAIGALKALKERKINVPQDVSIIGFDDMPVSRMMDPPLTSIRIYNDEIAKAAIKRLIEKIQAEDKCSMKIEVYGDLMIRESVKRL